MPITPTSRKKLLETARKNSVEARLRARIKKDHLHERDLDFLKRVVETVDYMRSKGKSEDEIRQHLRETKEKHALFGELLRNQVNIMGPRFNLFKRKSAAEKTAQKHQEAIKIIIGKDYPKPIVNHSRARDEALEAFKSIKK